MDLSQTGKTDWVAELNSILDASEQRMAPYRTALLPFLEQHRQTLLTKYRQMSRPDAYGRIDDRAFSREISYFVEQVIPESVIFEVKSYCSEYIKEICQIVIKEYVSLQALQVEAPELPYDPKMSGGDFESLVADKLVKAGCVVRFTPATGDQGADLIVVRKGKSIVIQCKRSAATVGNKAVQEAYAGRKFHDAAEAWVVSDAPFSRQAYELAHALSVKLVDLDQVEAAL